MNNLLLYIKLFINLIIIYKYIVIYIYKYIFYIVKKKLAQKHVLNENP